MAVRGLDIYYYFVCHRKLWLAAHDQQMEQENQDVQLGKVIDSRTYRHERKHIQVDEHINIDFLHDWKVIHEVKKSKKLEQASIWQIKYYMYYLAERGVAIEEAFIDYPELRERTVVTYTSEDEAELKALLAKIEMIKQQVNIPSYQKYSYCQKCAYFEYCGVE
ncbi:MAG: CRISPR-associated protein Cas4 [Culicoidibacterales bacterium]